MSVRRVSQVVVAAVGTLLVSGGCAMDRVTAPEAGVRTVCVDCVRPVPAGQEPLFILDGVVDPRPSRYGLDPADIENIEIVKGPAATQVYGERGRNGVVIITTKRAASPPR